MKDSIKLITISDIREMISKLGIREFFLQLIAELEKDFSLWEKMHKSPRHVIRSLHGVIELMPISDEEYYVFKYVNGHPNNPQQKKLTVIAIGLLAEVATGYPLLLSEMTLLTAFRTAATAALAAKYLAKEKSETLGIIGTGSQGEFMILAMEAFLGIKEVRYFDIDQQAMEKFTNNLQKFNLKLIPCRDAKQTVINSDIIITATAAKKKAVIVHNEWVSPGQCIVGIGGDCIGKTELDPKILERCKIVVEFLPQTRQEGEIQQVRNGRVHAELWEIITGKKSGRVNNQELTLFDSVGFALEDYSTLKLIYKLATQYKIGNEINLLPELNDPKDLFSLL